MRCLLTSTASHSLSHSVLLSVGLIPLNPTAAALAVAFQLAPQLFGDAQIGTAPETIHLTGGLFSKLVAIELFADVHGAPCVLIP